MNLPSSFFGRYPKRQTERLLALIAIVLIAIAWFLGGLRAEASLMPAVKQALPEADHFTKKDDGVYIGWGDGAEQAQIGYVAVAQADGYGGPLTMAVAVDLNGKILNTAIVNHKETPA
jgi:NosR/NirI family nitrous oxide reductase transcriptional regulator